MKILDYIVGFSRYEQSLDASLLSLTRESQRVRVAQSHKSLWLVIVSGLVYLYGLWDEVDSGALVLWLSLIAFASIIRVMVCRRVEAGLSQATVPALYRNEVNLYLTSLFSTLAVGAGFWMVGIGGSPRSVFALILLSLIYAIGTTVNSSIHFRGFWVLLITNLGQAIIYLTIFVQPAEIEVSAAVIAIAILLNEFARRNATIFAESIRMRDENRAQNIKLEKDKLIIQKALDMATSANEEKNRFMAAASHDLRQPLHALTLFLGSLRHLVQDEKVLTVVDRIDDTTTLLHEQFNSLLDLSKFDAGVVTADVTEFRLDHMLKNIADAAQQEAQQKGISLHLYTTPIVIRSDMLLMERMVRNLVTNAVRYTDSGAVSLHTRRVQHGLNIAVIDTGVGISLEEQQRIFQDYYQVSNKARQTGKGTGLGLAIVKRIANLLDIKITLKSSLGAGSTFNLLLPNRVVVDEVVEPKPVVSQSVDGQMLSGMKVLIVDDDRSILDAMTSLLDTWGCYVDAVVDVESFRLYLPQASQYDLVMLDDMLDDELTGLDLARQLQTTVPKSKILLVTGNANSVRLNTLKEAGFKVLVKPVEHALLHETLTHMANIS